MIQVRFFAWGKIPRFVCCIFCNCMFCLLISNWMNSEGGLLVLWIVTGFLFLRVRTRYRKGQYWWWELKSSSDSLRIQFSPFFSFAQVRYTQSYTYFCMYVWQNGRGCTLVSAGIECAGTKEDSASSVPFEFPHMGIWIASPRLFHGDEIIWTAEGDKLVIECAWEDERLHLCTEWETTAD